VSQVVNIIEYSTGCAASGSCSIAYSRIRTVTSQHFNDTLKEEGSIRPEPVSHAPPTGTLSYCSLERLYALPSCKRTTFIKHVHSAGKKAHVSTSALIYGRSLISEINDTRQGLISLLIYGSVGNSWISGDLHGRSCVFTLHAVTTKQRLSI
jgi:hypothetical protein